MGSFKLTVSKRKYFQNNLKRIDLIFCLLLYFDYNNKTKWSHALASYKSHVIENALDWTFEEIFFKKLQQKLRLKVTEVEKTAHYFRFYLQKMFNFFYWKCKCFNGLISFQPEPLILCSRSWNAINLLNFTLEYN